jgi:hypothetical protein
LERDQSIGLTAIADIRTEHPEANVEIVNMDMMDLKSVERAAREIRTYVVMTS